MIVTEIRQWQIEASTKEEALSKRKSGEGELISNQDVVNNVRVSNKPRFIIQAVPLDQWPIWAKTMRHFSKPEDKGMGDTVARMIGDEKSEAFKTWFETTFKKKCGCTGRQATWNILYPLKSAP